MLAAGNIATLDRYRLKSIVTACPHCFNTIGNEYGQLGGRYEVVHHSVYLQRLLAEGRLRTFDPTAAESTGPNGAPQPAVPARTVTFHDSCYLARYNGVVAEPRAILGAVPGLELREMERNGRASFCCGAGGGRMWMEETRGTRINAERTRQALDTGASTVATSCPFCMTMLSDGLASADGNAAGLVSAIDVAELLAQSLAPERTDARSLPVLQ
jgi:Fe-S oxidoreductase